MYTIFEVRTIHNKHGKVVLRAWKVDRFVMSSLAIVAGSLLSLVAIVLVAKFAW